MGIQNTISKNANIRKSSTQLTDNELWQAYHAGNIDAFGILFKRHQMRLFLVVNSWVKDPEQAQDIVQEVSIKILEKGDQVADIYMENFFVWATQFARNIWRSGQRNTRRRAEIVADEVAPFVAQKCDLNEGLDTDRILACLKKVRKPLHRRILVLVYLGYKNPEIAERLNKSIKWVKDNRCLAKKEFKNLLIEQGLFLS